MRVFGKLFIGIQWLAACSSPQKSPSLCNISITNNGVVAVSESVKDIGSKDECRAKGSEAFSVFCEKNASLSFYESSNLTNRYEWSGPQSSSGERSNASGTFGSPKCGAVQ